jgi:hypothetical protein
MVNLNAPTPLRQLAVPHQFQPQMTLLGAFVAVTAALAQILGGSMIGATWGVWIWLAAASIHSMAWKIFAILGLSAGLALSLGLMVLSVRALTNLFSKRTA